MTKQKVIEQNLTDSLRVYQRLSPKENPIVLIGHRGYYGYCGYSDHTTIDNYLDLFLVGKDCKILTSLDIQGEAEHTRNRLLCSLSKKIEIPGEELELNGIPKSLKRASKEGKLILLLSDLIKETNGFSGADTQRTSNEYNSGFIINKEELLSPESAASQETYKGSFRIIIYQETKALIKGKKKPSFSDYDPCINFAGFLREINQINNDEEKSSFSPENISQANKILEALKK